MLFVSRYCSKACITSADTRSCASFAFCAVTLIRSMLLKNADAAAASFLRMMLRVFGTKMLDRLRKISLLYFESPGCWLLNARMESSHWRR